MGNIETMELSEQPSCYLSSRGFEVIIGAPPDRVAYHYITLRKPQTNMEQSEVTYQYSLSSSKGCMEVVHPSTMGKGDLVAFIEEMVAEDSEREGNRFTTQPGDPFRVYVVDVAWAEVAKVLEAKYG